MHTTASAAILALALLAGPARAADFDAVMQAWCTQAGDWRGDIDVTVKVTYVDAKASIFRTEYFAGGAQRGYQYRFISVEMTDPAHWKTVLMTPPVRFRGLGALDRESGTGAVHARAAWRPAVN